MVLKCVQSIDFKLGIKKKLVCKQYGIPSFTHSQNTPYPYIKYWPEDGSLEPKPVAKLCTTDYILMLCLTEYITLWNGKTSK